MQSETLLLVGRGTAHAREVFETHADRLLRRGVIEEVCMATYETEPVRELRARLRKIPGERVYAVPMSACHTNDTLGDLPAALSFVSGAVQYCEPLGSSPAVTDVIRQRATARLAADGGVSLVLVGQGSSSKPYHRQMAEYHATRLRAHSGYGEVLTSFLVQDPAVECVRHRLSNERAVAVPLFLTENEATTHHIPEQLELVGGEIKYAEPFGTHTQITDAIQAELEKQRVLTETSSFETQLTAQQRPVATDGEGPA